MSCFQGCTGRHKEALSHQLARLVKSMHTHTEQMNYMVPAARRSGTWWCRRCVLTCLSYRHQKGNIAALMPFAEFFFLVEKASNCFWSVSVAHYAEWLQLLPTFLPAQGVQGQQRGIVTFLMGRGEEGAKGGQLMPAELRGERAGERKFGNSPCWH